MLLAQVMRTLESVGVTRNSEDRVLVGCSGGIDSVVLTFAVKTLLGPSRVVVGHVDHGVRSDSGKDADFVERLGRAWGLEVKRDRLAPGSAAEARLRQARYAALEAQRVDSGARFLLVAHTRDDQAETVLLGWLRTTHPADLAGMAQKRDTILRPMLRVPRRVVERYAVRHRLPHCEDATNREPRYLRNRVRKELLPLIETRYRAGFGRRLAAWAEQWGTYLSQVDAKGLSWSELIQRSHGSKLFDPESESAVVAVTTDPPVEEVPPVGFYVARVPWSGGRVPDGRQEAVFDAARVHELKTRCVRPGDRIQPFGFSGHRKVRDVLREGGVPPAVRDRVVLVADHRDTVLWVPGLQRSDHAQVSKTTQEVWLCRQRVYSPE